MECAGGLEGDPVWSRKQGRETMEPTRRGPSEQGACSSLKRENDEAKNSQSLALGVSLQISGALG